MRGVINGSGGLVTQDVITYNVHKGCVWGFYLEDTDLDTNETLDALLCVGMEPLHVVFDVAAFGGQVTAYIYEGVTVSSKGTLVSQSCFNRVTQLPLKTEVYTAPSITSLGKAIVNRRILAHAQGNAGITSSIRQGAERVFRSNTNYLLRLTAVGDNNAVTISAIMCES